MQQCAALYVTVIQCKEGYSTSEDPAAQQVTVMHCEVGHKNTEDSVGMRKLMAEFNDTSKQGHNLLMLTLLS